MRVLIVEDERLIAKRLERLLRTAAADDVTSVHRCTSLEEGIFWLEQNDVDVVFLDLNLNGSDGFDLLRDVSAKPFHTVIVSAHTERAVEAFEIGVLDFIAKPFGSERINKTIQRVRGARAEHSAKALAIHSAGRIQLVPVEEVAFVRAAGSYSELVLRDGSVRVHSKSLSRLLAVLPSAFERVHRSYLIRIEDITEVRIREGSRYAAVLASGNEIPIGRTRVDAVRKRLGLS